jgi:hypothetical protein
MVILQARRFAPVLTGYPVGRKEKLLPSPARWDIFQHAFALAVDVQERICHAMLALRAATDVIIRKIPTDRAGRWLLIEVAQPPCCFRLTLD